MNLIDKNSFSRLVVLVVAVIVLALLTALKKTKPVLIYCYFFNIFTQSYYFTFEGPYSSMMLVAKIVAMGYKGSS